MTYSAMVGIRLRGTGFNLIFALLLLIFSCSRGIAAEAVAPSSAQPLEKPAKFAVLAFRPKPETMARWQPVVDYLNRVGLGRPIELVAYNYKELEEAVRAKAVDFVLTQPSHYIILTYTEGLHSPLATLIEQDGGHEMSNFGGVIVTLATRNDISTLSDLRAKKLATSSVGSLGGYQMQAREGLIAGVDVAHETKIIELGQPQDKSINALLNGEADVAFVRTGLIESMVREGQLDAARLKVINQKKIDGFPFVLSTRLYPEWPLAAMPWTDGDFARLMASAILAMPHGGPEAQAARIHGFTIPGDYRPVDELLRQLRLPPFDIAPKFELRDIWLQYYPVIIALVIAIGMILILNLRAMQQANRRLSEEKEHTSIHLERIAAVEARQQIILSSLGEGVFGVDERGYCSFINPVALNMLGWQEEDILGRNQHEIFHHHYPDGQPYPSNDCPIFKTCLDGQTRRQEDCFWRKDGSSFKVQLTVTPQMRHGQLIGAVVVFLDVTERNQIAEELETYRLDLEKRVQERTAELAEARQVAEAASEAKSTFLANMSHEIRTPINAILGMAHLMRRDGLPPIQKERLQKLDRATKHLLRVINDILDFSKIEAGKMELEEAPLNLQTVLEEAVGMLADRAAEKGLRIEVEVPRIETPLLGDSIRLTQGILNYLANAIKFSENGLIKVSSHLLREDAEQVLLRFEVEDKGIGIAQEKLGQLFAAFQQADNSTTRQYGGTGLGLAVTRRLAAMMGGTVGAESQLGEGSTFWFTALLRKGSVIEEVQSNALPVTHPAVSFSKRRILVAEDEPINQEIILEILSELGMAIDLANDGQEALELVQQKHYDLVLMDMQMPRLDGLTATRAIRTLPGMASLPIVATTANAFAEDRARCLAAGMSDFIAKPVEPEDLLAKVRHWLQRLEKEI